MTYKKHTVIIGLVLLLFLFSCTSLPDIPEDMPKSVVLKTGQFELYFKRWDRALHYYNTYLQRYSNTPNEILEVEYEIAYIHYLRNDWDTAKILFNNILARYDNEPDLIRWPYVLTQKILEIMETTEQEKAAKKSRRKTKQET